mmetsp:Transcript_15987/g.24164  ORF Transcript_15987/g.24164 Transcript_15987/m.24164 type:complete len:121 (-) Transcript_15987:666-1028(-)
MLTTSCKDTTIGGSLMASDSNSTEERSPFHINATPSSPLTKTTFEFHTDGGNDPIVQEGLDDAQLAQMFQHMKKLAVLSSAVDDSYGLPESVLELYRLPYGCMFSYVVLGIWVSHRPHLC